MMYLRYILTAPLSLAFKIICWLPVVSFPSALFAAVFNLDRLPGIWAWIHTHNDDIYGSLTRREGRFVKRDLTGKPDNWFDRFKLAVWWLYRNPGYGFAAALGFDHDGAVIKWNGKQLVDGAWFDMTDAKGRKFFGYRRDLFYRKGGKRYIKIWFGWHNAAENTDRHMLKIDFSPFKSKD